MSISARIDKLQALLGGDVGPLELKTDKEIARDVAHILCLEADAKNTDTADHHIALAIVAILAPNADPEAWLRERGKSRLEHRWQEWLSCQRSLHAGSSLEAFEPGRPTAVPTVPRETQRDVTSPQFEEARMRRIETQSLYRSGGADQQTRAITGRRRR